MGTKHKSPSRIRYEEKTAVVSARLPKEQKEMLDTFLKVEKYNSFAEWLKDFLDKDIGKESGDMKNLHKAYIQGYTDGLKDGIIDYISNEFLVIQNVHQNIYNTLAWVIFDTAKKAVGRPFNKQKWQEVISLLLEDDDWVEKKVKDKTTLKK